MNNLYKKLLSLLVFGLLSESLFCGSTTSWAGRFMRRCMPKHKLALLAGFGGGAALGFRSYYDKQKLQHKEIIDQKLVVYDALALCEQQQYEDVVRFQEIKHKLANTPFDAFTREDIVEIDQWIVQHKDHPYVNNIILSMLFLNSIHVCKMSLYDYGVADSKIELVASRLQKYYEQELSYIQDGRYQDEPYVSVVCDAYQFIHKIFAQLQKKENINHEVFVGIYDVNVLLFKILPFVFGMNDQNLQRKIQEEYQYSEAFVDKTIPNRINVNTAMQIFWGNNDIELFFTLSHELEHVYQGSKYHHALHLHTNKQREMAAEAAACEKATCSSCLAVIALNRMKTVRPPYFCTEEDFFLYWKDLILQRKLCDKHFAEELFCVGGRKPIVHEYSYEWIDKNIDRSDLPEVLRKQDAELRAEFSRRLNTEIYR